MLHPAAKPSPITSIQPGGGWCMKLELAWGRLRRWGLRAFRPGYVRHMADRRQGECRNCPHDIIDARDLKFCRNVCGYWFAPVDDRFCWRDRLGLARVGLAEVIVSSLVSAVILFAAGCLYAAGAPTWIVVPIIGAAALFWCEVIYFFRDPERVIPADPAALVSPADGIVTDIGEVDEPSFAGGRALRVGIFLSIFNVHVNRAPRAARVTGLQYYPGRFFDARRKEAAAQNEQLWIDFIDEATQQPLRVKQISGLLARRIVCWLRIGDPVKVGERIGMIKFGSRTEIYLPVGNAVDVTVQIGQAVYGGTTVLLRFNE